MSIKVSDGTVYCFGPEYAKEVRPDKKSLLVKKAPKRVLAADCEIEGISCGGAFGLAFREATDLDVLHDTIDEERRRLEMIKGKDTSVSRRSVSPGIQVSPMRLKLPDKSYVESFGNSPAQKQSIEIKLAEEPKPKRNVKSLTHGDPDSFRKDE